MSRSENRLSRFSATHVLIASAPKFRGVVYLMAAYTGIRRGELNQLRWGDLDLDGPSPTVSVAASVAKNRKAAKLPLTAEVVAALRSIRPAEAAPFQWVFHHQVPRVRTFNKDLAAAGTRVIDDSGRRVDFHSLRVTFCTILAKSQVPLTEAMHLMRHSDPNLTMKVYTDVSHLELGIALTKLPKVTFLEANGFRMKSI